MQNRRLGGFNAKIDPFIEFLYDPCADIFIRLNSLDMVTYGVELELECREPIQIPSTVLLYYW